MTLAALAALVAALTLGLGACEAGSVESGSSSSAGTSGGVSLTLVPASVQRGQDVTVSGTVGDCPAGDTVTLISKAFPHTQDFAGVPALSATVQDDGSFSAGTTIPSTTKPGDYDVTARCGGGNLGLAVQLTVTG